jgi:hypothetical protein
MEAKEQWPTRWYKDDGFRHWFAWVEAITLSAGFLTLAKKSTSLPSQLVLGCMGLVSVVFVFFWALVWAVEAITKHAARISLRPVLAWMLAAAVTIPLVLTLVWGLAVAFYGFLSGGST